MAFYRKIYKTLEKWQKATKKQALCIVGARQIGKTTAILNFGKSHFKNVVYLNFVEDPKAKLIFDGNLDANTIITQLTAYINRPMKPGETLVFLDEIQDCPNARTAIKFLVQDGRFAYIESGSLLGTRLLQVKSYPVGFEQIVNMYPMDFEEFCLANGVQQEVLDKLQECFEKELELTPVFLETFKKLFYTYIVVGGMPNVVDTYLKTHDIGKVIVAQKDIINLYRMDISKYSTRIESLKIQNIFDSIPSELNKQNRRFIVTNIEKNARLLRYENCFQWLSDAGVALPCYNVSEPQAPLLLNQKHSLFKLFMGDIGLLCAFCLENVQFDILQGNVDINMGSILENVIAQELKCHGFKLHFYDSKKFGELDFVVQEGGKVHLIEAKSGSDYTSHKSLDKVLQVKDWNFGRTIVLCNGNVSRNGNILYLPWFMVMFLKPWEPESFIYKVDLEGLK